MLLGFLFKCITCDSGSPNAKNFPLCLDCKKALIPCPPLCPFCASPISPSHSCFGKQTPSKNPGENLIHSYSAAYLLLSPCYPVLKKWKTRRGPLLDRQILGHNSRNPELLAQWRSFGAQAVVPIPQHAQRSWDLGGSPVEAIARRVASELKIPLLRALLPARRRGQRQAELSAHARLTQALHFELDPDAPLPRGQRILLVDDFMTTGHTLRKAAQALRMGGSGEIHAFTLGVRPLLKKETELRTDLVHSARDLLPTTHEN